MIRTIALQELRTLLLTPLAWVILALIQFITALLFLKSLEEFMLTQPQLAGMANPPGVTDWVVAPMCCPVI